MHFMNEAPEFIKHVSASNVKNADTSKYCHYSKMTFWEEIKPLFLAIWHRL